MDALYAHLHRAMAQPFVWGECDCMLTIADYLIMLGCIDIGDKWRGQYNDALSCQRLSGFLTDPVKPLAEGVARIPLVETAEPGRGDIGVVTVIEGRKVHQIGAICLGKNWAVKAEQGLVIGPVREVLSAWKVPHA